MKVKVFVERVEEIERVIGLPWGNETLDRPAYIVGVEAVKSGNTLMEW